MGTGTAAGAAPPAPSASYSNSGGGGGGVLAGLVRRPSSHRRTMCHVGVVAACAISFLLTAWPRELGVDSVSAPTTTMVVRQQPKSAQQPASFPSSIEVGSNAASREADVPEGGPESSDGPDVMTSEARSASSSPSSCPAVKYRAGPDGYVSRWLAQGLHAPAGSYRVTDDGTTARPVRFHIYDVPERYVDGALKALEERWPTSFCNRGKKTNYTMLDFRHAHSLFTADIWMVKNLRHHPSHTSDPRQADVFIVPVMAQLYNCAGLHTYAAEVMAWVAKERNQFYTRMQHRDHFLFWWRWGMHYGSTQKTLKKLYTIFPNVNFISYDYLELQGRSVFQDFTLSLKPNFLRARDWIVMPYPELSPRLAEPLPKSSLHAPRKTLFFFAGTPTIGGIRRWIKRACEADRTGECVYSASNFGTSVIDATKRLESPDYVTGMLDSTFCGHAAGDALSSRRPVSAVLAGCIPVLICDLCLYAFENLVDYQSFAVFVHEEDVIEGKLMEILRKIPAERVRAMQRNLANVRHHFTYQLSGPPRAGDALDLLAQQLVLRGSLYRQYRRWFATNAHLSADAAEYPSEACNRKRYLRKGISTPEEERDFNNVGPKLAAALLKGSKP